MDKVYYNMLTTMILGGGYRLTTFNIVNRIKLQRFKFSM